MGNERPLQLVRRTKLEVGEAGILGGMATGRYFLKQLQALPVSEPTPGCAPFQGSAWGHRPHRLSIEGNIGLQYPKSQKLAGFDILRASMMVLHIPDIFFYELPKSTAGALLRESLTGQERGTDL